MRVVGIWTAGLPETFSSEKFEAVIGAPMPQEQIDGIVANLDSMRMTKRSPRLAEIAATAAFLAGDGAGAISGAWINATSGMFAS